jgi:tripartite-type tricarboxylate transporter receptor subunit TctC
MSGSIAALLAKPSDRAPLLLRAWRVPIRVLFGVMLAAFAATAVPASPAKFPVGAVTLVVPWPAGGTTDIAVRALAAATAPHLGQAIMIENRPGASGTLAPMQMAATARPDGYTIAQIPFSVFRAGASDRAKFDPATDLTYIIGLTGYTFGIVVRSDAPWATFEELLTDAKRRPGRITYGTSGGGTTPHLTMQQIAEGSGIDWVHVPFKGSAETTNALLGGYVDVVADGTSWGPLVDAGTLRLLVTWGTHRTAKWPTVPTLRETGIDIDVSAPYGLAGPKGMDPTFVASLHDAFQKGMAEPSYLAALAQLDQQPLYLNSRDYRAFVMLQLEAQKRVAHTLDLTGR